MHEIHKYPRTRHIRGSRFQHGDNDLEAVPWEEISGKHLVVEEKIDGSNCGVSFSPGGELLLQSRGHYLRGGPREKQFALLKQWASCHVNDFFDVLGSRYIMYGEWCYAKHTYFYDALPHYFLEFDILDTETGEFLDTPRRREMTELMDVTSVKVLSSGVFTNLSSLESMITRSYFITKDRLNNLAAQAIVSGVLPEDAFKHTDLSEKMEGLYVKWEEDGIVKGRYKYVRDTFTSSILDQETHWHDRPIIQNMLAPGVFDKMFGFS